MALKIMDEVEREIQKIIAEIVEKEPDEIDSEAKFVEDLGMDSMMALEILAAIEKKYRIVIPEDNLPKFTNLKQTVILVKQILNKGARQ